jgi:hypothetical protein
VRFVAVFFVTFVADWLWAGYIGAVANRHRVRAGAMSALIVAAGAVTTVSVVANRWLVIPACVGAFAGTWVATVRA